MTNIILFLAILFLAYSNGANDNFKGVATIFGSHTTNYKVAIWWATLSTFLGSIGSIFLAETLLKNFSGKGLVPDAIANTTEFHLAVAMGAGLTVILATLAGFPISTTHGLTGGLVGAGLMAIGGLLNARKVAETMSQKITRMNRGQGLSSNLVTGILVIAASQSGLPVSTTHVSVGSIFGVGLVSRKANPNVFYQILLSWLLTLPLAALFSGLTYWILHR
jgi:phosphate/sulfate permease